MRVHVGFEQQMLQNKQKKISIKTSTCIYGTFFNPIMIAKML
jgi:hypothetical protein